MGCSYEGQKLGAFGDAEVLSFHATKVLNSFEGGAILTNNAALANDVRLMRNFGFAGIDSVKRLGINAKMSEASGAMGLTSLESFDRFCRRNRRNYEMYQEGLKAVPGLRLYQYDPSESHNYHYIVVQCDNDAASLSRDELVRFLETENVLARRYFYPGCHRMQPYASFEPDASLRLINTERLTKCVMALPNGTAVNVQDVGKICAAADCPGKRIDCARTPGSTPFKAASRITSCTAFRSSPLEKNGMTMAIVKKIRRFFSLLGKLPSLPNRLWRFRAVIQDLCNQTYRLNYELDALKCSLQVDPELLDEFETWKAGTPIPAEPLVSVCVATYNRPHLLATRCLRSICEQRTESFRSSLSATAAASRPGTRWRRSAIRGSTSITCPSAGTIRKTPTAAGWSPARPR